MKGDVSDVDKQGRKRVREIKGPPQRKPGVKLYRRADGPWTMKGLGHVIPSSMKTDPRIGPNTDSFRAVDKVREFFGLDDAEA